ncbi:uncharacterized protein LOC107493162 [Arachis duranensis]|uniref:Uncharacterized protein LOC107493162 n=1 Tax=Arachis duranensis TaxID=130453 RepID=A0A6P4DKD0_ARADU|nr:uncharacterized protein LOC107493162 [Arachis duranensis]
MADNLDNDHSSSLEERTPLKNTDATPKDVPQHKGDKQSPNTEILDALCEQRDHLKQLEQEAEHQRVAERDIRRETRRCRELEDKLLKLEANLKTKITRSNHEDRPHKEQDPFTKVIMKAKVPKAFKAPDMIPYDGTSDPSHHLSNFRSRMYLTDSSYSIRCKAFPTTLTKIAIKSFDSLSPRSITSFDDLAKKFLARFFIQKDKAKHAPSLLGIKQGDRESLCSYMEIFNKACLDIQSLPTEAAIMGLINGLREGPFSHSISKKHPTSLNEVQERAEKYINMQKNSRRGDSSKTGFFYPPWDKEKEFRKKEDQPTEKPRKYHNYTPLRVSLAVVYKEICNTEKITPPRPIKHKRGGSQTEYCDYHQIYGHSTNECYDLKNIIEKLAREGRLDRGFARGGISKSSRKRHLKEVYHVRDYAKSPDLPTITFIQEDATGIISGHDDSVVITIVLANANLHRMLVDQGSSADILFKSIFDKLGLQEKELRAYPNSLFGLGDAPIQPLRYIPLHTTFRKED